LIGVAVVYVVYLQQQKQVLIKTKRELVKGREEVSYVRGSEEVRSKKSEVRRKIKTKIDRAGMAKTELNFDDNTKVKVEVKVERDSVELFFDLAYLEKSFFRVDTIKIKQLDTLKIETEKIVKEEIPFYEKFWFGAVVGAATVVAIIISVQ